MKARPWMAWTMVVLAAATAPVGLVAAPTNAADVAFTVAVGRDGDKVEYLLESNVEGDDGIEPLADGSTRRIVYQNRGLTMIPTATGEQRHVMAVMHGRQIDDAWTWREHHLDLATRASLRTTDFSVDGGAVDYYAPSLAFGEMFPIRQYAWQGALLQPGLDVTPLGAAAFWTAFYETHEAATVTDMSYTCTVTRPATLADKVLLGVACENEIHAQAKTSIREHQTWTHWFTEGVAYPVRLDYVATREAGSDHSAWERSYVLQSVATSGQTVPWSELEAAIEFVTATGKLERATAPGLHDGSEIVGQAGLEAAVRTAEGDVTLVGFQGWLAANPDAWLAGAAYWAAARPGRMMDVWVLTWAGDDLYRVRVDVVEGGLVAREVAPDSTGVIGRIDVQVPSGIQSQLPDRPATIAAAHELAKAAVEPQAYTAPIRRITWGWVGETPAIDLEPLRQLRLDYAERPLVLAPGDIVDTKLVQVDLERGHLLTQAEVDRQASVYGISATPSLVSPWQGGPPATTPGQAAPALVSAELGTISTVVGAAALLALLAMVGNALRGGGPGVAVLFGFSRLQREALLDHDVRAQVVRAVEARPGRSVSSLSRVMRMPHSTVAYHVGRLVAGGQLATVEQGNRVLLYPQGTRDAERRAVLSNPKTRTAYRLVNRGGATRQEIATKLGIAVPSVLWHLERLEGAGLVRAQRVGRVVRYTRTRPSSR